MVIQHDPDPGSGPTPPPRQLYIPPTTVAEGDDEPDTDTDTFSEIENAQERIKLGNVLRHLNTVQCERLDKLITSFAKNGKNQNQNQVYVDAQLQTDQTQAIWLNHLDCSDSGHATIRRDVEQSTIEDAQQFSSSNTSKLRRLAEHNVQDIFLTGCNRMPGFEAATKRRLKERDSSCAIQKGAAPSAPVPYDGSEPPLVFSSPLLERQEILPSAMTNALAIGSTGSGKTVSFVMPALRAMLDYRLADGKTASLLVIDPKVELLSVVQNQLAALGESERLVVIGQCDPISYFQDGDGLTLSDRFETVKSLVAAPSARGDDGRWQLFAEQLILAFLRDDQQFADVCHLPLLESVAALVTGDAQYLRRNQWVALRKLLLLGMESVANLRHISDVFDVLTFSVGMTGMDRPLSRYVALRDGEQFFYNARGALTVVDGLGSNEIEHLMDFSVRRQLVKDQRADVAELLASGRAIVFQPAQRASHDLVGAALKSLFFRNVMERQDMNRPVGYFCDEFQRFITTDPDTGEHTFLDRCRAYRVNCFLATQSMAALMAATSKAGANVSSSLDSILVNTPTKLCFRTTDRHALDVMKSFIPHDPQSQLHVLNFRPPSSLLVGEYYFTMGHQWGRTHYRLAKQTLTFKPDTVSYGPEPCKRVDRSRLLQQPSTKGVIQ